MLPKNQLKQIRKELEEHKNPLIFFHDDPDGLCSFLQFYRFVGDGKGVVVKSYPDLGPEFLRKVDEYEPDIVFVLDKPTISQGFIDGIKVKVVIIDHHPPPKEPYRNCDYYNPRLDNPEDNSPVSSICYNVVKQDIWIAMAGAVGDWTLPDFLPKFREEYPCLLPKEIKKPEDALYNSKLGNLVRIFSFILKGKSSEVMSCVKILTRVKQPEEILEQKTAQGKYVYKKYNKVNLQYQELLKEALKESKKSKDFLMFIYKNKNSFTSDLSNEMIYKFPEKIILIGREKNGEVKCSLRSSKAILPPVLEKALKNIDGYGGGHEHACGVCVKEKDFERFLKKLKELLQI
ncbi:hypothetical protein CMO89_01450 [Candidatus Woesearchaeota archaeon]|nr:hypothetical protein [Candidatus Woesearchaeota archaeon]|tara:strand:+ start:6043 stop:7080 length:1038 start_codon:yes stop_codon:yes gene_type:complete